MKYGVMYTLDAACGVNLTLSGEGAWRRSRF